MCVRPQLKFGSNKMKESEARAKAQELEENRILVFCPLKNGMCRIDCEAFLKPIVRNLYAIPDSDSYVVKFGYCDARALHIMEI